MPTCYIFILICTHISIPQGLSNFFWFIVSYLTRAVVSSVDRTLHYPDTLVLGHSCTQTLIPHFAGIEFNCRVRVPVPQVFSNELRNLNNVCSRLSQLCSRSGTGFFNQSQGSSTNSLLLVYYGHLEPKSEEEWVSACSNMEVVGAKYKDRGRRTWAECLNVWVMTQNCLVRSLNG